MRATRMEPHQHRAIWEMAQNTPIYTNDGSPLRITRPPGAAYRIAPDGIVVLDETEYRRC